MKRIFILLVIMLVTLMSTCSAATKWEWIYSDANHTYSIDRSSLKTVSADDGSIKSKRCFVKVTYTDSSAQDELRSANIYSSDSSIYSIFDVTFDFINDTAIINSGCLYNSQGAVIHRYTSRPIAVRDGYYAPVFYSLLQEFSGGNSFDLYKSGHSKLASSYHNSNGKKFNVWFDKLSVYKIDSRIYCKISLYGYTPDESYYDTLKTEYVVFDTTENTISVIEWSAYTKSRGWYIWNRQGTYVSVMYPDSWVKMTYEKVVRFCNENPTWVNRHNGSGIMQKTFVGHPII